jgi:hypothetical protein
VHPRSLPATTIAISVPVLSWWTAISCVICKIVMPSKAITIPLRKVESSLYTAR